MISRKFTVYGNLKMHKAGHILKKYLELGAEKNFGLFVPYPYLVMAREDMPENIIIGAQSVASELAGAYTSQVSVDMLLDLGIDTVMIGHSEVRAIDSDVSDKLKLAYEQGLKIIYCIGEDREAYASLRTAKVLTEQLKALPGIESVTIAYEPIWSIGTGLVASCDDINAAVSLIREVVAQSFPGVSDEIAVLYGGSINNNNCLEVFNKTNVNGFLIGGASLEPEKMLEVIRLCK
jgi:triosephosphate isomerase